jgi:hypothetical protein
MPTNIIFSAREEMEFYYLLAQVEGSEPERGPEAL